MVALRRPEGEESGREPRPQGLDLRVMSAQASRAAALRELADRSCEANCGCIDVRWAVTDALPARRERTNDSEAGAPMSA